MFDSSIIIYGYTPSFALAVLACVLFFLAGIAHVRQLFKYRTWYFSTMIVGILFVRTPLIIFTAIFGFKYANLTYECASTGNHRLHIPLPLRPP